jgi:phage-related protein
MKLLNDQFEDSGKTIEILSEQLKNAKTTEEIDLIFNSIKENINNIGGFTDSMKGLETSAVKAKNSFDLMHGALQAIGDVGIAVEAIMTKNWIGMLISLLARLANSFGNISNNAAAAANIFDVLFDVIEALIANLGPALDAIFKPLLDIVVSIGRVIGAVIQLLMPILTLLFKLIDAFNILSPVLNIVAAVISLLADALGHLYNFISDFIYHLSLHIIDIGHMATDNLDRMMKSITQENDYSKYSNSNNSSSYTVAGDMYINFYFEDSVICGSPKRIALELRNLVREAEAQGY